MSSIPPRTGQLLKPSRETPQFKHIVQSNPPDGRRVRQGVWLVAEKSLVLDRFCPTGMEARDPRFFEVSGPMGAIGCESPLHSY